MKYYIHTMFLIPFWIAFGVGFTGAVRAGEILRIGSNDANTVKFPATLQLDGQLAILISPTLDELTPNQNPAFKIKSSTTGKEYAFDSYPEFSKIKVPICVEASVIYKENSASLADYKPNSIGAWERLKNSDDFKNKKLLPPELLTAIDNAAVNLKKTVLPYILDTPDKGDKGAIGLCYNDFSNALEKAFDETRSFDVKRQLYVLGEGVTYEQGSWEKFLGYVPVKASSFIQKSFGSSSGVSYKGYENLQQPRPPLADKILYRDSRACVGIAELGENTVASGTIIGKRLVLTCAHIVSRPDSEGNPALDPTKLVVRIGDDSPQDPDTTPVELPASIVMQGTFLNNNKDGDALDFTLLEISQDEYDTYVNQQFANKPHIEPLALAYFNPDPKADFYITGHPKGGKKKVTSNGKILYPFELSEKEFKNIQNGFIKIDSSDERTALLAYLDTKYTFLQSDLIYQYRFGKNSPGMGVVCSTVGGYSGAAAITQKLPPKVTSSSCVIGILVQGMPDSPNSYVPSLKQHEILLPVTSIIAQADTISPAWAHNYDVKIYVASANGSVTLRNNPH